MRSTLLFTVLSAALVVGCSRNINPDDTNGNDDTGDTDTGGDTDTDTDTGGDTDTEPVDTDTGDDVDCQATYTTPAPGTAGGFDSCVTDEIGCGDVIYATTVGGSTHYDDAWGSAQNRTWIDVMGCVGEDDLDDSYDAPERVYVFDHTGGADYAKVSLDDSCGDLSLRIVRSQECASTNASSYVCDASDTLPNGDQAYNYVFPGYSYAVIVDGRNGYSGNFRLEIECP